MDRKDQNPTSDTSPNPRLGELPGARSVVPTPNVTTNTPATGEDTKRQAMLFQPSNAAVMAGVVGLGGWDSCAWGDWIRPQDTLTGPYTGSCPAPGIFTNFSINGLPTAWPGQYTFFRKILNDPSIRFVRELALAPILATKWAFRATKDSPPEAADVIREMFESLLPFFLDDVIRGVDYGWAGFEQVFDTMPRGRYKGAFWLKKLKSLMPDITTIYVDNFNEFAGFNNNGTPVDPVKCLLYTYDGESGNLYGRGRCYNLLEVVPWWRDANDGAARYDRKIAGVFLICHYPPGQSIDRNGVLTENWKIAQAMLDSVSAGKPIAVCNEFAGEMEQTASGFLQNVAIADRTRWKFELLEDKGSRQPGFSDRLAYLDRQKARAYLTPERSAFEAQKSGSRADSESHGGIILTGANYINARLALLLNGSQMVTNSPINNILRMNWGDDAVGTVTAVPEDMNEEKKKFLREISKVLLGEAPELTGKISSLNTMFEQAGFPQPSDPLTDGDLTADLGDMMIKRVAKTSAGAGEGDGVTMSRIRRYFDDHPELLNGNGHKANRGPFIHKTRIFW